MNVPKPVRILVDGCAIGAAIGFMIGSNVPEWWARLLLCFAFVVIVSNGLNMFDMWVRKFTKDPIWLMSHEGKEWLREEALKDRL